MCGARYAVSCAQAEVRAEMEGDVISKLRSELREEVVDILKAEMQADPAVMSEVWSKLTDEIYHALREAIINSRPDDLINEP